jgi:hypothetical protein
MTTGQLYYGGVIPDHFKQVWYADINKSIDILKDNMLARRLLVPKPVDATIEEYSVTYIDATGDDVVPQAKNSPGHELTMGGGQGNFRLYRYPTGFTVNEADLKKKPEMKSQYVDACARKIFRGEDKVFFSGHTGLGITGMQAAARANANGKITTSTNHGAWLTVDVDGRDIYEDIRDLRGLLDAKYRAQKRNLYLVGNAASMDCLDQKDPYNDNSTPISLSVAPLLGRTANEPVTDWAIVNEQITSGYVYLVTRDSMAGELLEAQPILIDDNYPRQPIGNLSVQIYEDIGIAIHDAQAFAELAIG